MARVRLVTLGLVALFAAACGPGGTSSPGAGSATTGPTTVPLTPPTPPMRLVPPMTQAAMTYSSYIAAPVG